MIEMWDVESLKFKRAAGYFFLNLLFYSVLKARTYKTTNKQQYRVPVSTIKPWQKHAAHLFFNYWLPVTACIKFKALMHTVPHLSAPSNLSLLFQIYKPLLSVSEWLLIESYEVIFKYLYKPSLYLQTALSITVQGSHL